MASWLRRANPAPASSSKPAVVLFGDSITQWSFYCAGKGFGEVLENRFSGVAEVWNEGQAGYTSTDLVPNFETLLSRLHKQQRPPLLLTICLGANDACLRSPRDPSNTATLVTQSQFVSNLRHFVDTLLTDETCHDTKILLITPPPINVSRAVIEDDANEDWAATLADCRQGPGFRTYVSKCAFAEAVMRLAEEYAHDGRVAGCDVWRGMVNAAIRRSESPDGAAHEQEQQQVLPPWPAAVDWSDDERCVLPGSGLPAKATRQSAEFPKGWFTDGLHLGASGYEVFTAEVLSVLDQRWPGLVPEGGGVAVVGKRKDDES